MQKLSLQFKEQPVQSIFKHDNNKFVQLSFEAGQTLANHKTANTLALVVVEGKVHFGHDSQTHMLEALDMVVVEPNQEHSVEALERSIVLLVLLAETKTFSQESPSTQPLDHENAYRNPDLIELVAEELRPLTRDHIALCQSIEAVTTMADKSTIKNVLDQISEELKHHFVAEEKYVFPLMSKHLGGGDVGPVARLLEEHEKIRNLSAQANAIFEVYDTKPDDHVQELLKVKWQDLSRALLNHLGKEDSHLFPMASRLFTPEEKASIAVALKDK